MKIVLHQPIIISEIVADSHQSDMTTTSGRDAFEYFELYNTSNQSINLDDYQVLYDNGSTISEWNLPANTIYQLMKLDCLDSK